MTDFAIRELFFFKVISHLTMSNEEPYRKNTGRFTRERRCTLYKYKWFQLILVHTVYTFIWCFYKSQKHFHVSRVRIVTPRCFLYIAMQVHVKNHARCPINNKISLFSNVVLDCCNSCFPVSETIPEKTTRTQMRIFKIKWTCKFVQRMKIQTSRVSNNNWELNFNGIKTARLYIFSSMWMKLLPMINVMVPFEN